jgi:hypothetical protein
MKFINTHLFKTVDWDKEIATSKKLKSTAEETSKAFIVKGMVENLMKPGAESMEDSKKANCYRIIEYFYAKSIYHHARYCNREEVIDIAEAFKDQENYSKVMKEASFQEIFKTDAKPTVKLENIIILGEALYEGYMSKKPKVRTFEEALEMFKVAGLENARKPLSHRASGDRDVVETVHDGVRYNLYLMKGQDQEHCNGEVQDYRELVGNYHPLIKELYNKLQRTPGIGRVWVMEGGGMQQQAFFGNKDGYIGILYLGMKGKGKAKGKLTFQINSLKNDALLTSFQHEGIEVRTSFATYGNL